MFLGGAGGKTKQTHLTGQETEETGLDPWVEKIPLEERKRRKRQPAPVVLPGESHEQSSLAGYSPQGHKESDTI